MAYHPFHQTLAKDNFILAVHLIYPATVLFIKQFTILRWRLGAEPLKNLARLLPKFLELRVMDKEFHGAK